MKLLDITLTFLALALLTTALPGDEDWYVRRAEDVHLEGLPIVDLTVTDDRFPGRNFTGTAEAIWNQMKELKPDIVNDAIEEPSLEERAGAPVNCKWGKQVGSWNQCIEGQIYLKRLGRAKCDVSKRAPACARVSCSHNCGIYLCNKRKNGPKWVHCGNIPRDVQAIGNKCANVFGQIRGRRDFNTHFIGLSSPRC